MQIIFLCTPTIYPNHIHHQYVNDIQVYISSQPSDASVSCVCVWITYAGLDGEEDIQAHLCQDWVVVDFFIFPNLETFLPSLK